MATAALCIQCTDEVSGKEGSFLAEPVTRARRAISPVFPCLTGLYEWCKANGWKSAPYSTEFPVGLYHK